MTSRPRLPRFYDTTNASGLAPKSLSDALFGVENPLAFWAGHYFTHSESPYFMFHPCIAFPGPSIFGLRLSSALVFLLVVVINRFGGISRITVTAQNLDFYHATRVTHVSFLYVKFMARPLVSLHASTLGFVSGTI